MGAALAASLGAATAVHAQTDGLLVYMSFDDGGGDTANNTVGDDGVLVESPSWVAGEVGGALEFDGTTNYVEIPIDISPQAPGNKGQLSIAAWVKVLATETDGHAQTRAPIVLKGEGDGWEYGLYVNDDFGAGMSVWNCAGSGVAEPSAPGTLPQGEWHHVCGTFDVVDGVMLYVDGELVAEAEPNGNEACDGASLPRVGSRSDGQFLNAVIDEVAIWERALSIDEVNENMNGGLATPVELRGKLATSWGLVKRRH